MSHCFTDSVIPLPASCFVLLVSLLELEAVPFQCYVSAHIHLDLLGLDTY
jgi:hypothetical protein